MGKGNGDRRTGSRVHARTPRSNLGVEFSIKVPQGAERVTMLGVGDRNLKIIREALGVSVLAREGTVHVSGERDAVAGDRPRAPARARRAPRPATSSSVSPARPAVPNRSRASRSWT
jgi:phosphate starvation-inducible protein PhoH